MNNKELGDLGEFIATEYLKQNKYTILEQNYKVKVGEIDIICKKEDTLVFVEVKTRQSLFWGNPSQAVNYNKQVKIKKTACWYLQGNYILSCRFDVIEIYYKTPKYFKINHIENAFE